MNSTFEATQPSIYSTAYSTAMERKKMKVSIIIPTFNEERTIAEVVNKITAVQTPFERELIVINDGSSDKTQKVLESLDCMEMVVINHPVNRGKGAAIRTGIEKASGEIILVQDADLEYSPEDYPELLNPILNGKADVVYGSRFIGGGAHRVHLFWHYLGNKLLTTLSNVFTNLNLTDMEVGSKVFRADLLKQVRLVENRFGFEPEVTAKISRLRCRIYEVPISYYGRSYSEGKKIGWKDGVSALRCIFKYALFTTDVPKC